MDTTFGYERIDDNLHDFRVLRLLGSSDGELECELYHATLRSEPYEALSYSWGNLELVEAITVNGKTLRITDNLSAALHHLRLRDQDRVLWIDAICINQSDNDERASQVRKMRDIYQCATNVVIWLGKATVEVELLMHWLKEVEKQNLVPSSTEKTVSDRSLRLGLRTLLQRPWFSRVWILQEVANARLACVFAGKQSISASTFAWAPESLDLHVDTHRSSVLSLMSRASTINPPKGPGEETTLGTILLKFQGCKASDERDKIYALQGMLADHEVIMPLLPDYDLPTADVVHRTLGYLFELKHSTIRTILDYVSSFTTVTTVCLVLLRGPYSGDENTKPKTYDANLQELLECNFDRFESGEKASFLCVEQQSSIQDQGEVQTCYGELDQLSSTQAHVSAEARQTFYTSTWRGTEHNVKLLFIDDVLDAVLRSEQSNLVHTARFLITSRAGCSANIDLFEKALWEAIKLGRSRVLQMLLDAGEAVNALGGIWSDALEAASARGHEKTVQMLLDTRAKLNVQKRDYSSALLAALRERHEKVVQMLLGAGAEADARYVHFGSALQVASASGSEKMVQMLLDAGADVNALGGRYGNALPAASVHGSEKMVQMLLDAGADVNALGGRFGNALHGALVNGSEKMVQTLLDAGADANALVGLYGNALEAALAKGSGKMVQMLLDAGADVNALEGRYGNALQAALVDGSEEMVQMLLDAGADVNAHGGFFGNALHAASARGSEKMMQMLLDAGADVNMGEGYGSALQAASLGGHKKIVEMLLDAGAEVDAREALHRNALQAALDGGHEQIVEMLLKAGA